ncbi:hypothetical protein H6F75_26890 [Nodosilinea sp. FACHB-131]|uniref:hypothetical protein n=1 Tax=Cyanophyceae TaxID=3028117 RepID=UPI001689FBAF|nr:hypothetical protein [Nodosilinea sp. FACHB-131]MBD1877115.1 hypothetical protein [Nodosilinea sp. FACHB-131]
MSDSDNTKKNEDAAKKAADSADMKRKKAELTKSWSAGVIGMGFLWPWEVVSRPKRSLLLLLGFFASLVAMSSLFIAAKAALFAEGGEVTPSLSTLLDPSDFGAAVGTATRNTVEDATTLLTGKDGKERPITQLDGE